MIPDWFAVLGIPPTRNAASIKQAYFRALAKVSPHADPQGFRRLRGAYEALSDPEAACAAWLRAPIDARAEREAWKTKLGGEVELARRALLEGRQDARALDDLIERLSGMSLEDARNIRS